MKPKRPALKRIGMDGGGYALDAAAYKDGSNALSYSDIYESSPELRKLVEDDEIERRRVQDCRFGKTSADAGATVQTTRRKSTFAGYR